MIDVTRARTETPGCDDHVHLNNAGASLPPRVVLDTHVGYLQEEAIKGGYETASRHHDDIERVYADIAGLIDAGSDEIALTANATEAWQLAFHSFRFQSGDRILTGEAEYASNYLSYLKLRTEQGISIEVIPSDELGQTSPAALAEMMDDRVRLIAVTHIPTNGGLINPASEIGHVARNAGVPFLLDACQSVGQIRVDVKEIGCDFLSATGRKFLRGPRGTGFLYVRRAMLDRVRPPFLDLRGATWTRTDDFEIRADARRYENWEFNVGAILGLGAAVRYADAWGMDAIEDRVVQLGADLRSRLATLPGVTVFDTGASQGGITTFAVDGTPASTVQRHLSEAGIRVSVTTPASTLIDATRRGLPDLVRASVHYYNTESELEQTAAAIARIR